MHILTLSFPYPSSAVITSIEPNVPSTSYIMALGQLENIISCTAFGIPLPNVNWVTAGRSRLPDHVTSIVSLSGSNNPNYVTTQLHLGCGFS